MEDFIYNGYLVKFWDDEWTESPREWSNLWHLCLRSRHYSLPWETNISNKNPTYRALDRYGDGTFMSVENDVNTLEELQIAIKQDVEADGDSIAMFQAVAMLDHSSVAFRRSGGRDPFNHMYMGMDSGICGIAYITRKELLAACAVQPSLKAFFGARRLADSMLSVAGNMLDAELEYYTSYSNGTDMVGYSIHRIYPHVDLAGVEASDLFEEDYEEDQSDSCGGFYCNNHKAEESIISEAKAEVDAIIKHLAEEQDELLQRTEV